MLLTDPNLYGVSKWALAGYIPFSPESSFYTNTKTICQVGGGTTWWQVWKSPADCCLYSITVAGAFGGFLDQFEIRICSGSTPLYLDVVNVLSGWSYYPAPEARIYCKSNQNIELHIRSNKRMEKLLVTVCIDYPHSWRNG